MAEKKSNPQKYEARKFCPKCGPGYRLAEHKDRRTCGKCAFTEMKKNAA